MTTAITSPRPRRIDPAAWLRSLGREVRLLGRVLQLLLRGHRRPAILLAGLMILQAMVPVAQLWLAKGIADALVTGHGDRAMLLAAGFGVLIFTAEVLRPWQDLLAVRLQDDSVANTELALIRAGSALRDMVRISDPAWRDRMGPVRRGAEEFSMLITQASRFYGAVLSLIGVLVSLLAIGIWIPVALLVSGVISFVMAQRLQSLEYTTMWKLARQGGEMDYTKWIATRPESAAEVRMFGIGPWLRERYNRIGAEVLAELGQKRRRGLWWAIGGTLVYVVVLAGAFWYVVARARAGELSIGDLALFFGAIVQAQIQTHGASRVIGTLHDVARKADDFFAFIDTAAPSIAVTGDGAHPADEPEDGIAVRHVSFTYPHGGDEVLHDVSLDLPAGTVTALVGDNGAGKSTLVSLLARMFDPASGEMTLDGLPYPAYDLTALRDRITIVYQNCGHFALTLEDNIAIGDPGFSWTDPGPGREHAREVGDHLGVDAVAATLSKGYATDLTRQFDESAELSGGQWQLVAFARGLVREDAGIAMLDEPSSALDPVREAEQIAHLRRFAGARRRSVLLISHRLSTVRHADRIAVLDSGRITEVGTHDALLAADGTYAELFRMQSQRYRDTGSTVACDNINPKIL